MNGLRCFLFTTIAICLAPPCFAHPVPRRSHDRTITVSVGARDEGQVSVRVNYRLEVDEFTALYEDLLGLGQSIDLSKLTSAGGFHGLYAKTYAPILAGNLR